jgi:hypothetical protein
VAEEQWTPDQLYIHFTEIFKQIEILAQSRNEQNLERFRNAETSFRDHVESAASELRIAFSAAQLAITKAEAAQNKRNDEAAIFASQLTDRVAQFPTRAYIDARFDDISGRFETATTAISDRVYAERDAKSREMQGLKLLLAERLTIEAFDTYVDRQEELRQAAQNRQEDLQTTAKRQATTIWVGVGLGVGSLLVTIIIAIVTHHG